MKTLHLEVFHFHKVVEVFEIYYYWTPFFFTRKIWETYTVACNHTRSYYSTLCQKVLGLLCCLGMLFCRTLCFLTLPHLVWSLGKFQSVPYYCLQDPLVLCDLLPFVSIFGKSVHLTYQHLYMISLCRE